MTTHRMRGLLLALVGSLALALPVGAAAQAEGEPDSDPAPTDPTEPDPGESGPVGAESAEAAALLAEQRVRLRKQIRKHRAATWRWQRVMQRPRTRTNYVERRTTSVTHLQKLRNLWRGRAKRAAFRARRPPHRAAWLCIHRYEGPWNDPHAPYYGGLQMDLSFQQAYGRPHLRRKGTANRWTPLEQMWTAERAFRSGRGFYPWPNTARRCGLI